MNTSKKHPHYPEELRRVGEDGELLALRIIIPGTHSSPYGFTERVCSEVFHQLVIERLEKLGCEIGLSNRGFAFNNCLILVELVNRSDRGRALPELLRIVTKLGLLQLSFIAWDDEREGVWRLFHPKTGEFPMPTEQEWTSEREHAERMESEARKHLGDQGPPPEGEL
jgi:hypothetical protein